MKQGHYLYSLVNTSKLSFKQNTNCPIACEDVMLSPLEKKQKADFLIFQ